MWKETDIREQQRNERLAAEATLMSLAVSSAFNGGKASKLFQKTIKGMLP